MTQCRDNTSTGISDKNVAGGRAPSLQGTGSDSYAMMSQASIARHLYSMPSLWEILFGECAISDE